MPTLTFLGHAACEIATGDTTILIDPYLTDNPAAVTKPEEHSPAAILISHGHNDHVGDALDIARRSNATIVANFEIAMYLQQKGAAVHPLHIGGGRDFPWGRVKLTPAWHGSTYIEGDQMHALGVPCGLLLRTGDRLLYHAGDTALFSDMALIGREKIHLALLPIGDNFTMGPDDAREAVKLLKPETVVPIHYNTFDLIRQDPAAFARRVQAETSSRCVVLQPGEQIEY
jgi:L-ascorbate metabolism protein UlaG (beta-lactamase superfamily)